MLPRELRRCTLSAGLILNTVTGVIIHCKALWVVSHTRKALYKNQLLSLLYFSLQAIILHVFYMNKPVNLYWRWWRMETAWGSIQWVPIKRKPERAVSSPLKWNIISIITNFNSSSLWIFNVKIRLRRINGNGLYVQTYGPMQQRPSKGMVH